MTMQPPILIMLVIIITRPFGNESAKAPTNGARTTYEMTKKSFSIGVIQAAAPISRSRAMAAISSALSAREDRNCAAMIV